MVAIMKRAKKVSVSIQPDLLAAITRRAKRLYGGNISAVLTNSGFSIPTGARLRIQAQGYPTNDIFTLNAFGIAGNGDFLVSAQSGNLSQPGSFSVTDGSFTLLRTYRISFPRCSMSCSSNIALPYPSSGFWVPICPGSYNSTLSSDCKVGLTSRQNSSVPGVNHGYCLRTTLS